jgi:hypothetical protein
VAASEAVELGRLRARCDSHLRKPYGCGLFLADFSRFDSSRETSEGCPANILTRNLPQRRGHLDGYKTFGTKPD